MRAKFAVISPCSLVNIGLKTILERIIPAVEVCTFGRVDEYADEDFVHYFVSARVFTENSRFFIAKGRKVIILTNSAGENVPLPPHMFTLDIAQDEASVVRDILRLYRSGHGAGHSAEHGAGEDMRHGAVRGAEPAGPLSEREKDVLRAVVRGMINKEIADALNISINTVITHRRNIVAKLGIRSVAALTIYAVTHGIISLDNI